MRKYITNAVESLTYSNIGRTLSYHYDGAGNISRVVDSQNGAAEQTDYLYDGLNQLIRVNDSAAGKTTTYTYDNGGNILTKRRYSYTTGSLDGRGYVVVQYTYGNENWKDLLTAYNGNAITYDAIGNPLTYYNGTTFTWDAGRQLSTATKADGTELSFKYNDSGIRTSKTVDGTTTQYFLDGTSVIAEKTGNNILWFYYDGDGSREAVEYNGAVYYYLYNAQGDVLGLFDNNLNVVVNYTYDSWGNLLSVTGDMANTLGQANPFRYRGYYYDTETGLYYLNSRYYDPETGRFINADGYVSTGQDITGYNMFVYCGNNSIDRADSSGTCWYDVNGNWCHDNWEYIPCYDGTILAFTPDPRIAEKQAQLQTMGFKNVTSESAASYLNTIRRNHIDTKEQEAHFLAQCAYETNFGQWLTEIGSKAYFSGKPYGYKYRGAGYIQLTWDYNYMAFADAMGNAEIYNQGADYVAAHYAWQAAGWWWSNNNINAKISNGATVQDITRIVRGSSATWLERQAYYNRFIGILG